MSLDLANNFLAGKVAVVTGASKGIGNAVARALADRGASLLILARSAELDGTAAELRERTDVISIRCDVAHRQSVDSAITQAFQRWGHVDVLVNAAAVLGATGELWTTSGEEWDNAIDVNLRGTYNTMRAVLPYMTTVRRGKIVNFAGGGAAYGYPRFSAYAASKAAVVRLTETVALECAPYNVQVNAVAPGAIETDMLRAVRAAGGEVRTVSSMEQALELVLFLLCAESDHVSGRFIHARDDYKAWQSPIPADSYTLRRIQA